MDAEDVQFIQRFIAKEDIDAEKIAYIAESVPGFVGKQMKAIEAIKETVNRLQESQDKALDKVITLDGLYKTLNTLAESAESDEAIVEIARITKEVGKVSSEISKYIKEMNKDNNRALTYLYFGFGLAGGLLGGYAMKELPIDDYLDS
ncbi:hypothetical protein [Salinibacter ruber]|uniref:hypothetical protein n=1 Tax=Salinibacter ruber TaxID=146919 RepID=UPI0016187126|nr:hypothetical protein [Salinibacter ruber]MBB4059630.1 uncharacterized protein Yka (UPF0111/DUF47 family) [Salinibacter ruber]